MAWNFHVCALLRQTAFLLPFSSACVAAVASCILPEGKDVSPGAFPVRQMYCCMGKMVNGRNLFRRF